MDSDKPSFRITHTKKVRNGEKMNVIVRLLQKTVDDLEDPDPIVRMRAEHRVCSRFETAVTEKYHESIKVTCSELFPPELQP